MSEDQRRDPRVTTRQKLWCEGQDSPTVAETRDMSKSGMFIVADDAPAVGSQFSVSFDNEEGEVSLQMEVMWRGPKTDDNKTGVGVRIVGIDKGRDAYERFLKRHMKDDPKPRPSTAQAAAAADAGRPSTRPAG